MSSMTAAAAARQPVFAGVDTHKATHHVAVVDVGGTVIDDREFRATAAGSAAVTDWLGRVDLEPGAARFADVG